MEQQKPASGEGHKGELSLKELILHVQDMFRFLFSKWLIIIIFGVLGAAAGLIYATLQKPKFLGDLTFILEEGNKGGGLGAYAGLASQFGIDMGSMGGNNGIFAGDNIIEFLKSRLMVEKTLLTPITQNGKEISLADFYIDFEEVRKEWTEFPQLKNLHFPPNADRSKFTLQQDSVLFYIYGDIVAKWLTVNKPDKKLSFISVKCLSPNEEFSKVFTERLVKEATTFYIETKTKRSKVNVDKLQEKADSIERLLNQKTYSAAAAHDLNLNPARSAAMVSTELVTRDKIVLQTMYSEVVKNLEISRMSMAQETPIIQVVDTPIYPLIRKKLGRLKGLIIGGLAGGFLICFWLVIRRAYKQIMN